jgi:tetratricopeptide (TPR) repeat protein
VRARRKPPRALDAAARTPWPWLAVLALSSPLLGTATAAWLAERDVALADAAGPKARRARLERAFARDPRSPSLAVALGVARLQAGEAAGAARALEVAVALRPSVAALLALGNARRELGQAAAARREYERAVALMPTSFRARVSLASALLGAGDLDGAARHLAAARTLYPGDPRVAELEERLRRARLARATGG